jgi:hypothetical protein
MEGGTRYKIEHMGDSFVDMLDNVCGSIKECKILKKVPDAAKASTDAIKKGVPDAAKASFDFVKKAPGTLKVPDLFKKVPSIKVSNPLDLIKKVPDAAKSSARGVILTYDIHELGKKKEKLVKQLGDRIVELRREAPGTNTADDETVRTLLLEIDAVDSTLQDYINEREMRLYPAKGKEEAEETAAPEMQAEVVEAPAEPEAKTEAVEEAPAPEEPAETDVKGSSDEDAEGGGIEVLSAELADEDENEK